MCSRKSKEREKLSESNWSFHDGKNTAETNGNRHQGVQKTFRRKIEPQRQKQVQVPCQFAGRCREKQSASQPNRDCREHEHDDAVFLAILYVPQRRDPVEKDHGGADDRQPTQKIQPRLRNDRWR